MSRRYNANDTAYVDYLYALGADEDDEMANAVIDEWESQFDEDYDEDLED